MATDWVDCTIADACSSIDYGLTASANKVDSGAKFLRITDIVSGAIDWNAVPTVDADAKTLRKYALEHGDVVLARTGASTGASAYVNHPPESVFASYLVRLKAKPEFDSRYLAYYLQSEPFLQYIRGVLGDKSAQPNASASTMTRAPFRAPRSLDEQRRIAHILGTLDDKIELNRRMSQTLEEMARALFKSWFVDFDPVRAKAEGRDPGLPKHLADLFPDRLIDSDLGEIPEGWEPGTIAAIAALNPESWKASTLPEHVEYVDLASTKWGDIDETATYTREDAPSRARRVLRPGDTIVGTVRPGNGAFAYITTDGLTGSTGFAVLRSSRSDDRALCYLAATNKEAIDALAHLADGGAYPAVRPEVVLNLPLAISPLDVRSVFDRLCSPWMDAAARNRNEGRVLATVRSQLLPMLLSEEASHQELSEGNPK
ncbi:restriction endonuclease subunit S [Demequina sp.]|uniref:restriction endonuclease subunit S n=1 Tax=Demequina sp. TaxID=2050685 RepID=UPI0025C25358|nr:restriction endonuclease subunit S [Demequina sp.]